jgi:hypothetical protein
MGACHANSFEETFPATKLAVADGDEDKPEYVDGNTEGDDTGMRRGEYIFE